MAGARPHKLLRAGAGPRCSDLTRSKGGSRNHEQKGPEGISLATQHMQAMEACEKDTGEASKQGREGVLHSGRRNERQRQLAMQKQGAQHRVQTVGSARSKLGQQGRKKGPTG